MIAVGESLEAALGLAVEVETAGRDVLAGAAGRRAVLLDDEEMERVIARFATYGR